MASLNKFALVGLCILNLSCLVMPQQRNLGGLFITSNGDGHKPSIGESMLDRFLAKLNNAPPASSLGERTEFKELALTDHVNDDSFESNAQEMIEEAGFESVTHLLTSSDGYITELINIVNPLADRSKLKQPPVIMFHGALIDSTSFLWASIRQHHPERFPRSFRDDGPITSSNRSLALMLANNGYDVWLAGTRGSNKNNIGHVKYKTEYLEDLLPELGSGSSLSHAVKLLDTLKYLDLTQDTLVEIEYPEQISEVCKLTGSEKVSIVTYSKAAQVVFKILASDRALSRRIHSHVTLAPPLNEIGSSNLFIALSKLVVGTPNGIGNLFFTQIFTSQWVRNFIGSLDRYTGGYYFSVALAGPSPRFQTFLELPVIGHILMPTGFTDFKQLCQQLIVGKLQKYDHGPIINKMVYNGSATPPEYDISSIKLKRWMMVSGETDVLGTPDSAQQYYNLHRYKPARWIRLAKSNHVDVSAAFDNDIKVNLPILDFMETYKLKSKAKN